MKYFKHILLSAILLTFMFHTVSYAQVRTVTPDEYDPRTMTLEERSKWVDENVEPIQGTLDLSMNTLSPYAVDTSWRYSEVKTSSVGPEQYTVGSLTTAIKYKVDAALYSVEAWGTVIFSPAAIAATAWVTEQVPDSFWVQKPGNYRMLYEVWFADPSGGQFIEHWYNIYGDGQYSLQVVNGMGYK